MAAIEIRTFKRPTTIRSYSKMPSRSSSSSTPTDSGLAMAYRRLLLHLAHLLLGVALWLGRCYRHTVAGAKQLARNHGQSMSLMASITKFNKIPVHLALVVDDDRIGAMINLTACLVAWCVIVGIPYVTLYDHRGMLKSQAEELRHSIDHQVTRILPDRSKCEKMIMLDGEQSAQNNNLQQLERKDVVHVQLLRCEDGQQDMVESAKRLADQRRSNASKETPPPKLVIADFTEQMQSNRGFPSPDVLICCGQTFSTLGFLPWHINLTEIFYSPTHGQMTFDTFEGILSRFDKCEQRLGK